MRIYIAARIVLYHLKNHYHLSFNHILPHFNHRPAVGSFFYFSIEMYITVCNNVISVIIIVIRNVVIMLFGNIGRVERI